MVVSVALLKLLHRHAEETRLCSGAILPASRAGPGATSKRGRRPCSAQRRCIGLPNRPGDVLANAPDAVHPGTGTDLLKGADRTRALGAAGGLGDRLLLRGSRTTGAAAGRPLLGPLDGSRLGKGLRASSSRRTEEQMATLRERLIARREAERRKLRNF